MKKNTSTLFGALIPPPTSGTSMAKAATNLGSSQDFSSSRGLVGLSNLGNTCYMNAALQCLLNQPALVHFFLDIAALSMNGSDKMMSKALLKLVEEVWSNSHAKSYVAPTELLHSLKMAFPMYRGFLQHDSQEFLRNFLDKVHEELQEVTLDSVAALTKSIDDDRDDDVESNSDDDDAEEAYETAEDSGVSEQSSLCGDDQVRSWDEKVVSELNPLSLSTFQNYVTSRKRRLSNTHDSLRPSEFSSLTQSSETNSPDNKRGRDDTINTSASSDTDLDYLDAVSTTSAGSAGSPLSLVDRVRPSTADSGMLSK